MQKNNGVLKESKPLKYFFIQSAFGAAFTYLTSGLFLSGLAILMGAGDVLVSYLSVIVNICGVLILAFSAFLERFKSRKRLSIILAILTKAVTFFIVLIPAFIPKNLQLIFFIPTVIAAFTLQAQTTVVLNQWMMEFIDEKKSGRYISFRQTLILGVTVLLSMTSGYWMDYMEGKYIGFVIFFSIAAIMGVGEIIMLASTPDKKVIHISEQKYKFWDNIKLPLKNRCFTGFVFYVLTFYLLLYISDSFTMVYMMKYLALPYKTVTIMYMIISLPQVVLLGIWGKISDKMGHDFVLRASIWLFAGETFFMFFSSSQRWYFFIPIAFLISSAANAGFVIAVFNRRYELMPEQNRIVYDNFYTGAIGFGFILGPMIGGAMKNWLETSAFASNGIEFASIRYLYLISTVGILLLQIIYCCVQKNRKGKLDVKDRLAHSYEC